MAVAGRLSVARILDLRMRSQGLAGRRAGDVAAAVRRSAGLQAQSTDASRLGVRCRSRGLSLPGVVRACNVDRTVVRTWLMRGTLHMVAAEDVRWQVDLLGPSIVTRDRRRRTQLGLDDGTCARALPAIRSALAASGPLDRSELVRRLDSNGVSVNPEGQAPAHLVAYACARGLTCRGPDRDDGEPTYVLLDDWVGDATGQSPDEPLAELARRYIRAYGPAGVADFARWSGVAAGAARRAFETVAGEFVEVDVLGRPGWLADSGSSEEHERSGSAAEVRLLPAYDGYLLGYADRDLLLDPAYARRVNAGGGVIHPTVLVGGRVAGTWRRRRSSGDRSVVVEPFAPVSRMVSDALEAEVDDLGRFLGTETRLEIADQR